MFNLNPLAHFLPRSRGARQPVRLPEAARGKDGGPAKAREHLADVEKLGSKEEFDSHNGLQFNRSVDAGALEAELRASIQGEVRFDNGSRALYATDGSNYRQVPIGVVIPRDAEDIEKIVALCRKYGAPLLSRGGGTSLAGQCCNVAIVMDHSKYYNQILSLDPTSSTARVQPGVVLDTLRDAAEQHNLTFGPDPSTHNRCTLGGMIGNNSCGVHALMAGKTVDNIESMEILTYDGLRMEVGPTSEEELNAIISAGGRRGEIYAGLKRIRDKYGDLVRKEYPNIPRRVSGYNLDQLLPENGFNVARALVGTESTCVTVLEATCRLVYSPPGRTLVTLGYKDIFSAGDHVPEILQYNPIGLEAVDDLLVEYMKRKKIHPEDAELLPPGGAWLLVEFGGKDKEESDVIARRMMDALKKKSDAPTMKLFDNPWEERMIWIVREAGLAATARIPGERDAWEGWEDSAVRPDQLGNYLRDLHKLLLKYDYEGVSLYGHFGQACVHIRIPFDLTSALGIENFHSFLDEASTLVVRYGGSLSGEHGDGQSKAEFLDKMYSPELLKAFEEFKELWDPQWKMNPGKIVRPNLSTEDLRLGVDYAPWEPKTHFNFVSDEGSFARAALRCVGVGECRRHGGGTMCPSYLATMEEKHSTRGRGHLLFEMLRGETTPSSWQNEDVKEALDLCLACKGCKGDCPMHVDMATYKAEFLAHYYEHRIRPRNAYAFGFIGLWSKYASKAPYLVNFLTQTPGLAAIAKFAANIAPQRKIPQYAAQTFKDWFFARPPQNIGKPLVILWPDTFNNYFHPDTAKAAVEVIEELGYQVHVPREAFCCGRPLYDYGFVPMAKKWLSNIIDGLRPYARAGVPVIVLEPSCLTVFRDEMADLFPHEEDARRLHDLCMSLSEFLIKKAGTPELPKLNATAIVQGHCHHKSVIKFDDEEKVMSELGLDYSMPEASCCGMAGAFGFENGEHFAVAQTLGQRNLLPAVKQAPAETLIIADGFSCREQIEQNTGRRGLHLAQVLKLAFDRLKQPDKADGEMPAYPERMLIHRSNDKGVLAGAAATVLAGALVGFGAYMVARKIAGRNIV